MTKLVFRVLICVTLLTICLSTVKSARILALFPTFGKSHLIIQMEVIKTIMNKGHDITVVTTLPLNDKNPTYRHVKLPEVHLDESIVNDMIDTPQSISEKFFGAIDMLDSAMNMTETTMINLWKTDIMNESFDLVVFGVFLNEYFVGVAAHFKCPLVVIDTHKPMVLTNFMIGNPTELSYVPSAMSPDLQPLDFFARVRNFLIYGIEFLFSKYFTRGLTAKYEKYFPLDKHPTFEDALRNVSLILHTSHFSDGTIRPQLPALIEIGGIQAKPTPDPLPKDLQKIMDEGSKYGVVYFSLGSNVKSSDRNADIMKSIYNVLAGLKQTVIWKWENDAVPGNASNIFFRKWLPQDDILAHPNLRLFVTHCGLGSVVESKFHGVPIVAIPFYGDQTGNANRVVEAGYGLRVDYHTLTEESFGSALNEVLDNAKYRNNIQAFSKLFRDRPMGIRETTAYWLEYVIRHRGAKHMQSPAVHMSAIEYHGLDVVAFIFACLYVVYKIVSVCVCKLCRCGSKSRAIGEKRKNE